MRPELEDIFSSDDHERQIDAEPNRWNKRLAKALMTLFKKPIPLFIPDEAKAEVWSRIEGSILKRDKFVFKKYQVWLAAASIVLVFAASLFLLQSKLSYDRLTVVAVNRQSQMKDSASVRAEEGKKDFHYTETKQSDVGINDNANSEDFKTITVPFGKFSEVTLPDGTEVRLNAGSQLTYLSHFEPEERSVFLEGEAFFNVAADKSRPFLVRTTDMVITALGTSFTINSYLSEESTSAMLVTGKIRVENLQRNLSRELDAPGKIAIYRRENKSLEITKRDLEEEMSWTRQQLILRKMPLGELLKKISRIYNIQIDDQTENKETDTFSGRLDLTKSVTEVLTILYDTDEYRLLKTERRIEIQQADQNER